MKLLGVTVSVVVSRDFHTSVAVAGCVQGTRIVPAGQEREALAPLPLHALPLSPAQAETFHLWGIHTLGQLANLPAVELIARMGQDAQRLRQLARGELPHLFRPIEPVFALREQVEFEEPVELLDSLLFVISPMLGQLIARAASRSLAIASLDLHLRLDGNQSHQRTIKPALPSTDRKFLLKLVQLDLAAHPPLAGVLSLMLTAEPDHSRKVQLGLFAPQLPDSSRLDVTLSRLAALVGEDRVGSPVLTDTHRPDSFRQTKLLLEKVDHGAITSQTRPALRRLRPSLLLHVHTEQRRPASFHYETLRYTVTEAYGPWRAGGDWWAESLWSLDAWDVIAESEQHRLCCVLTQDRAAQQWRMEAVYD
jgi:protein ImuB